MIESVIFGDVLYVSCCSGDVALMCLEGAQAFTEVYCTFYARTQTGRQTN